MRDQSHCDLDTGKLFSFLAAGVRIRIISFTTERLHAYDVLVSLVDWVVNVNLDDRTSIMVYMRRGDGADIH